MSNIISIKPVIPIRDDIQNFLYVVFGYLDCDGFIALRSFAEKNNEGNRPPCNSWIHMDEYRVRKAFDFANCANESRTACYVIPGIIAEKGKAGSSDITQMQVLLVDIDEGDTEEKLRLLEKIIGDATMIVESGGVTEVGKPKMHLYWQLEKAVMGNDLQRILKLRHQLALAIGGDTHFKSAHQPIRVAGSVYHKGGVGKLVRIRSYNPIEYELSELIEKVSYLFSLNGEDNIVNPSKELNKVNNNSVTSNSNSLSITQILKTKVHEGAKGEQTRFNHITKIIGYWLRRHHEGLVTMEEAITEILAYNAALVMPPWPMEKLVQDIERLWEIHTQKYGMPKMIVEQEYNKQCSKLIPINPSNWQGDPPIREWILQDWLPRGYVTAIYGDGGVGKSLLAQQLMTALACGREFMGITLTPCKIYALMCEDDHNELWRRQVGINNYYGITMEELNNNIRIVSRVGENNLLITFNNSDSGQLTNFFTELQEDILAYKPDLIILDTAADLFGGNENNRPQVRQFIQTACGALARSTEGAVLLCAHPSEGGIQKGTGSGGSTAWNNTVRSRWYLKRPQGSQFSKNHRVLTRVKSNYATSGEEEYFEVADGSFIHLNSLDFSPRKSGIAQGQLNDAERDRKTTIIIKLIEDEALKGRFYTINQFAENFEGKFGLGSKRCIHSRVSVAATLGLIKFFQNPRLYGINIKPCNYGYLCTDNTLLKAEISNNPNTGEIEYNLTQIIPTMYKSSLNGSLLQVENYN